MAGYLDTHIKSQCFGCEACVQVCAVKAIHMTEDSEGFRYPRIDSSRCRSCGHCRRVCPYEHSPAKSTEPPVAFGGYHRDQAVRQASTSGGAFSAVVNSWCDLNYVIFGAAADGLAVCHRYIEDKAQIDLFRKSKYVQSRIGSAYQDARNFLREGHKVLFSGTPCQIAGLKAFLGAGEQARLLTVEVVCEGVPSPHFIRGYAAHLEKIYRSKVKTLDYRDKDGNKWDFEVMSALFQDGRKQKIDRWFNPFWPIWLDHLMSRPSCYACPYATPNRSADITLGDLWGVHLYCPELYGHNGGASLVVCSTEKGRQAMELARREMFGHDLDFQTALQYQGPMRRPVSPNERREEFMEDLHRLSYKELCRKWAKRPSLKLLWSKYVWGNRQKVFIWELKQSLTRKMRRDRERDGLLR